MNYIDKPNDTLDDGELELYWWQYNKLGSFKKALFDAISKADTNNLRKLSIGYPLQVEAYRKYINDPGYWKFVQERYNNQ